MGRLAALLLLSSTVWAQAPDAKEIIRKSIDHDLINYDRLKNYTYTERDVERSFDKQGKVTKTEIETYEILILGGRDYERLIARNDKPLSEKETQKEQEKMDKVQAEREHESDSEKARREKQRQGERKFLDEVPEAFVFTLLGEEDVSGKPAWVIQAEPKPGYQPEHRLAKVIVKLHGKVWIDKAEYQWVKVDAQAIAAVSFGLGLVKIDQGASLHFEQTRINDEIWLPARAQIHADARLLFKHYRDNVDMEFHDYKKFQADSKLVTETDH